MKKISDFYKRSSHASPKQVSLLARNFSFLKRKKSMKKEQKKTIAAITFALTIALVIILFSQTFQLTGFAVFESQPASEGADTYLRQDSNVNFGSTETIRVGKTAGDVEFRSLIKFDISSIPQGDTIANAKITLHLTSAITDNNITLTAYRATSNWSELETGWSNSTSTSEWNSAGGDYLEEIGSTTITNQTIDYNITITSVVKNWVNGSHENYGVLLLSSDAGSGDYKEFASSDYSTAENRPKITIEHTDNLAPAMTSLETNSSSENPATIGETILFTIEWSDEENDDARIFICNSGSINLSGCSDTTFCSTSYSSTSPVTCQYTTTETDNKTTLFYGSICDDTNCSAVNQSEFYTNHPPTILLIQPDGGETLNQSEGNYSINFNVSDNDDDSISAILYYGSTQNSTTNTIATLSSLSSYCTDSDSQTSTTNNCTYSWNTSGLYGTYFLTVIINDSFSETTDSSTSSFDIRSIVDDEAPIVTGTTIESQTWSGKITQINATITDENMDTAWVSFSYGSSNITMTNLSTTLFTANFTAPTNGTYTYTIHTRDILENTGNSSAQEFTVHTPNATSTSQSAPSIALPFHTIKITGTLYANNSLANIYAYLNTPEGFGFMLDYPQNNPLGNVSDENTSTATWYLSVPLTEGTYTLNITYTDDYSNSWNSENMEIEVASAIGGYEITVSGYTEVETSNDYYTETKFKQNGLYTDPDSMEIKIYDAAGSLTVGPASMTQESTGEYNYSYTIGASATEGLWETRINATKDSTSYYTNEFWKVVGGPFDVRDVTIQDSAIDNLTISFTAENTGGANKDLLMTWNLTREDTDELLHSGGETFMVSANSERNWTITPETSYIGQVKITIIGYYSGGEKAGAYRVFSTTAGSETPEEPSTGTGGGSSGRGTTTETTEEYSITIEGLENIYLTKNIEKIVSVKITNTGDSDLTNLIPTFTNLEKNYYSFIPLSIPEIKPEETKIINLIFTISDLIGEKDLTLSLSSNEKTFTENFKITVLSIKDFFLREIERLANKIDTTDKQIEQDGPANLLTELNLCKDYLETLKTNVEKENYIDANSDIERTDKCIDAVKEKIKPTETPTSQLVFWIMTIALIAILIVVIIAAIKIYKKLGIFNFLMQKENTKQIPKKTQGQIQRESISDQIKNLKEKITKN